MTSKVKLKELVQDFRKWLSDNFSDEEIKDDRVNSTNYENWKQIEDYFAILLKEDKLKSLDEEDRENLLYLIGRNWDIGRMLAWLSPNAPLSYCGELKQSDFITLTKTVKNLHEPEFQDAKSQIIVSFQKFPQLTDEIKNILLDMYESGDEYTKRTSMQTLGKLGYSDIRALVERSWREQEDEHHRIMCLQVIKDFVRDVELLNKYLQIAELDSRPYISHYVQELKKKTSNEP